MSNLTSMLMPLTTNFPGWPQAPDASVVQILVVILAIPLGIGAIITVLTMAGALIQKGRGGVVQVKDPVWIGQTAAKHIEPDARRAAVTTGAEAEKTGGTSASW